MNNGTTNEYVSTHFLSFDRNELIYRLDGQEFSCNSGTLTLQLNYLPKPLKVLTIPQYISSHYSGLGRRLPQLAPLASYHFALKGQWDNATVEFTLTFQTTTETIQYTSQQGELTCQIPPHVVSYEFALVVATLSERGARLSLAGLRIQKCSTDYFIQETDYQLSDSTFAYYKKSESNRTLFVALNEVKINANYQYLTAEFAAIATSQLHFCYSELLTKQKDGLQAIFEEISQSLQVNQAEKLILFLPESLQDFPVIQAWLPLWQALLTSGQIVLFAALDEEQCLQDHDERLTFRNYHKFPRLFNLLPFGEIIKEVNSL